MGYYESKSHWPHELSTCSPIDPESALFYLFEVELSRFNNANDKKIHPAAMVEAPFLSIVTINRNNGAGLYKTLRSVERLDMKDRELIVVDGDSTDGSAEIARDFSHIIDTLIAEPDDGIYAAMNKGARATAGEWVIFMNSGDSFAAPDALNDLPFEDSDIIHGQARAYPAGHVREYASTLWKGMTFCHQAALTRRGWITRFPFDESRRVVADWEFFVKCERERARFHSVDRVIAEVDDTGLSYGDAIVLATERLPIALRHYGWNTAQLLPFYLTKIKSSPDREA